jgi:teichuronic acid biosynthesis glycosyltransferase TuaC
MKVLFVISGNNPYHEVTPFIRSQGDALAKEGVVVDYFPVKGKGAINYLRSIAPLRRYLKTNPVDVIHAHYSLCGWVAVLAAGGRPVVLSYMGDDLLGAYLNFGKRSISSKLIIGLGLAIQPFLSAIICKSEQMTSKVFRKKICHLVPNGVRLDQFKRFDKSIRQTLGMEENKQYVLFLANPSDPNKNITLVKSALALLRQPDVELLIRFKMPHDEVVQYLNAADVFVLCSFSEGSPNVIKEAMACNCPIVAANTGDVAWVLGDIPGCYVAPSYDAEDFAQQLRRALAFAKTQGRTQGRVRLTALGLDAESIARKITAIYTSVQKS